MTPVLLLVGVALGLAGLAVAVTRPRLVLAGMVVMDVTNLNGVIAEHVGVSPFRPLLALALIAMAVLARQGRLVLRSSPIVLALMVLLGCVWVNAALSTIPATSAGVAVTFTIDIIYFLIVYVLLCSLRSWAEVLAAATVALAVLAAVGVGHQVLLGGSGDLFGLSRVEFVLEGDAYLPRHSGTVEDVNFWGRLLLLFLPTALSFAAVCGRRGAYGRLSAWAMAAASLVAGIYLTQSRGAFLALPVGVLVWMLLAGWRIGKALLWAPLLLFILIRATGAWERLAGLTQFVSGGLQDSGDLSLTNRLRLMQDAGRMFMASPWTGQGIGTFPERVAEFDRYANTPAPPEVAGAAHNFYLEQAADGGVLLLAAWLLVAIAIAIACWRSLHLLDAREVSSRFVVVGAASGLVAWLTASTFLHLSNFRALLVVIAVIAAVEQEARRRGSGLGRGHYTRAQLRRTAAGILAVASSALVLAGGLGLLAAVGAPPYRSTALLTIGVEEGDGDYAAYQLDLISRGTVAPSFAEVLQREYDIQDPTAQPPTTFTPSREGGGIVVRVAADTPQDAQAAAEQTVGWAIEQVAALDTPYVLRASPAIGSTSSGTSWQRWLLLALGVVCGLGSALLYRRPTAQTPARRGELTRVQS